MAAKASQPKLRNLTVLLAGFLLFHGLYQASYVVGDLTWSTLVQQASDLFFEPFGYLLFFAFAAYFARSTA